MKILAIQGSPRKKGNTSALLRYVLEGMEQNVNISIDTVTLCEEKIQPCRGCSSCQDTLEPDCVIKDSMRGLYDKILEAELIVLATPLYWWNVSFHTKIFIDRLYALMMGEDNRNLAGKKLVVLLTYGGSDPNSGVEIVRKMFREITDFTGMGLGDVYGVCSGELEVEKNLSAANSARQFGAAVTASSL